MGKLYIHRWLYVLYINAVLYCWYYYTRTSVIHPLVVILMAFQNETIFIFLSLSFYTYCFKESFVSTSFLATNSFRDFNPILPDHFLRREKCQSISEKKTHLNGHDKSHLYWCINIPIRNIKERNILPWSVDSMLLAFNILRTLVLEKDQILKDFFFIPCFSK